jgi:hypothetical protein
MSAGEEVVYPLGKECQGILTFDSAGKLAAQLMNPHRANFASNDILHGTSEEIVGAYQGYVAFWGSYEIDEARTIMRYHVEGSLFPNWVGHPQERFFQFDGDRLTLKTTPVQVSGKTIVGVLIWERIC